MRTIKLLFKGIGLLILIVIATPVIWLAFAFIASPFFPPYTFSLTCTYDLTYRLNAVIEVGGRQYSAQVVHQQSHSRRWIEVMNSAGCSQTFGTALPFRLADNRLILLRSNICNAAQRQFVESPNYSDPHLGQYYSARRESNAMKVRNEHPFARAMAEHHKIDVTQYCAGLTMDRPYSRRFTDGFVIDNTDHPTRWKGFEFGDTMPDTDEVIRLISVTAEADDTWPADDLNRIAPAILKTNFKYTEWWDSPEAILEFFRRYNPDKKFTYQAEHY